MHRRSVIQSLAASLCALCSAAAAGGVQVLHDSGRSVPLSPYLAQLVGDADAPGVLDGIPFPLRTSLQSAVLPQDGTQVFDPTWLTQPMFVVAADEISMRWLAFNHDKLVQLQAVGIVVQAANPRAFNALHKLALPLHLTAETSPWLASRLHQAGAGVYPLLVQTNGRVFQILEGLSQ